MAANRGTGKLLFITGGVIFLIALIIIIILVFKRNSCPAEVKFEILPGLEVGANELITVSDKTVGKIESWEWDFGDNSKKESYHVSKNVTHTYAKDGNYIITLKVNGCATGASQTITVKSQEVIIPATPDLVPVIEGPTVAYVGQQVKFKDATPGATSWEWFFENGQVTYNEKEVTHQFITQGEKTIQLLVNGGKSQTTSFKLKVLPPKPPKPEGGGAPGPGKTIKPIKNDAEFKAMLNDFIKRKVQMKDFISVMNGNMTLRIQVNDERQQFDSFLKDLLLEGNPQIERVSVVSDPATGWIEDLIIKKN